MSTEFVALREKVRQETSGKKVKTEQKQKVKTEQKKVKTERAVDEAAETKYTPEPESKLSQRTMPDCVIVDMEAEVDDAIYSFAASLRANRRVYGSVSSDGPDDDALLGWTGTGGGGVGAGGMGNLSSTLPPGGLSGGLQQPYGGPTAGQQPLRRH